MNLRNILYLIVAIVLVACENEEKLVSEPPVNGVTFVFPEGDDAWDHDLKEIADKFGTKCIYKNLTYDDFFRTWTAGSAVGSTGEYIVSPLKDTRHIERYTRFFLDHIFAFLPAQCTEGVLPSYIYFAYDFCSVNLRPDIGLTYYGTSSTEMKWDGMGYWSFCFETEEHVDILERPWQNTLGGDAEIILQKRDIVLRNIFKLMVEAGTLVPPAAFEVGGGLDYVTPVVSGTANIGNENYYKRRGFPAQIINYKNYVKPTDLRGIQNTGRLLTFIDYINLALRFSKEQIYTDYADFPLVIQYYDLTVKHMKDVYGVDITKVAEMPEAFE